MLSRTLPDGRDPRIGTFRGESAEWDDFVRSQQGWTHFHLYDWKRVIEAVFGHECIYLVKRDATNALIGILPLVRVKSRVFGHFLVSMPFVNYGGPLGTPDAMKDLAGHATEIAANSGAGLMELRSRAELAIPLDVSHRKVTLLLDLPSGDPDKLWKSFKSKLRSQIRRPQKEGLTVRFGLDRVDDFFHVFSRHMRDLGTPTQPVKFFKAIANAFPETVWFGCAYLDDRAVAAGCGFQWGSEFEMTWASSLVEYNRTAPNMLLYWSFMEINAVTRRRALLLGAAHLETAAPCRCESGRSQNRSLHTLMLRKQLPVYSPLTPSSILAGWRALAANDSNATAAIRHLIGEKYGTEHILLTDSGTSALTLAIRAYCRIRSTPLVALPAYCCYDIATAADGADVEVILYDIDARTLSPDIQSLSNALSRRPGAIVVAHLYGVPVEVQDIIRLCEQHQVPVIEDAAQGHGAQYDGLPLGSFGDVSILSFGRGKGVTGGGGGALLAVSDGTSHVIEEAAQETGSSHRGLKPLIGATAQWLLASPTMYAIPASLPFLRLGQTIYREPTSPMGITHSAAGALARNWVISEAESVTRRINAHR
ncbi:MAG: GNAT family N-acetyltransferase, partial [Gemmatimonadales bacterium]